MAISLDYNSRSISGLTDEAGPLLDRRSTSVSQSSRSYYSLSPHFSSSLRSTSVFSFAVICILMTELCERLTYYGITASLQLFAAEKSQLNFTEVGASVLVLVFQGTCLLVAVFTGWLADSVAGKYLVISFGTVIYFLGAALLPIAATSQSDKYTQWANSTLTKTTFKRAVYITGLVLLAFGTGAIKVNVSPFGAEQVSNRGPEAVQTFFRWFYWFTNVGAFISFTLVVYVQQEYSYFYGYIIPAVFIILTLIIFRGGKGHYQIRPPAGSPISKTVKIVKEAIQKLRRPVLGGSFVHHWLDRAKASFGGSYTCAEVEDVKKVFRLIPLLGTFILYWTVYAQMNSSMLYQGKFMDINVASNFKIPVASILIFPIFGVLLLIPIMDKIVYPFLSKHNINLSQLQRIGIGMIITTLGMVCAGGIELYRVDKCCTLQHRHGNPTNVSHISIFYQVPQYTLIGLSEVFTAVTGLELAYSKAPESLQGVIMGAYLFTIGLGAYVGAVIVLCVNAISGRNSSKEKWYPDKTNINEGKLARYFFLLAGLMVLNFILYIFVASRFKAKGGDTHDGCRTDGGLNTIPKAKTSHEHDNHEHTSVC